MVIKKNNSPKTTQMIVDDIMYSFTKLTSQNNPILSITINNTGCKSAKELRFHLTNKLFNKLNIDYKNKNAVINYLFVIEYPTKISIGNLIPDNCLPHAHVVLATSIPEDEIEIYIKNSFDNPYVFIEDITKRNDKLNYLNYLTKQRHLLTADNYNYKIKLLDKYVLNQIKTN